MRYNLLRRGLYVAAALSLSSCGGPEPPILKFSETIVRGIAGLPTLPLKAFQERKKELEGCISENDVRYCRVTLVEVQEPESTYDLPLKAIYSTVIIQKRPDLENYSPRLEVYYARDLGKPKDKYGNDIIEVFGFEGDSFEHLVPASISINHLKEDWDSFYLDPLNNTLNLWNNLTFLKLYNKEEQEEVIRYIQGALNDIIYILNQKSRNLEGIITG